MLAEFIPAKSHCRLTCAQSVKQRKHRKERKHGKEKEEIKRVLVLKHEYVEGVSVGIG